MMTVKQMVAKDESNLTENEVAKLSTIEVIEVLRASSAARLIDEAKRYDESLTGPIGPAEDAYRLARRIDDLNAGARPKEPRAGAQDEPG